MNKAVNMFWESYKDAMKERGIGKLFPRIKKKDLERMSMHDVFDRVIDKITGKDIMFDRPLGELSDEEWDELNERMEKRADKFIKAMGFDMPAENDDTPPIYGEEQNN